MYNFLTDFIRNVYAGFDGDRIPLHSPVFMGEEKVAICNAIDSTFVSTIGSVVGDFEELTKSFTGSKYAVATNSGTSGLHLALLACGVTTDSEVITQSLTFVGTINAIRYCGASPNFIDIDYTRLSLSSDKLQDFLISYCEIRDDGKCWNKKTNKRISACVPMHTLGLPADVYNISKICKSYNIPLIEDAAESLGSWALGKHTGTIGDAGMISFNGNKIVTTGGGGVVFFKSASKAKFARHLGSTARVKNELLFEHDHVGFNYRMPNLNAALGVAQLSNLPYFLKQKAILADRYRLLFKKHGLEMVCSQKVDKSNNWLNTILLQDEIERDLLISFCKSQNIEARPFWKPMHQLNIFKSYYHDSMEVTENIFSRAVSLPSGVPQNGD
jgi:aminotransferase in exopolysaccharide biosynthesis